MSVKKIISLLLLIVLVCSSVVVFAGCDDVPSNYTLEQHKERVSERITKFINRANRGAAKIKYTDFQLYPLYNDNDELNYFLVELEPSGFMFVEISSLSIWNSWFGDSMYYYDDYFMSMPWRRYKIIDADSLEPADSNWVQEDNSKYPNRYYEVNENGKFTQYTSSPYKMANVLNEKLYYLNLYWGYICATKISDNKYYSLISMQEIEYKQSNLEFFKQNKDYVKNNIPYLSGCFCAESRLH